MVTPAAVYTNSSSYAMGSSTYLGAGGFECGYVDTLKLRGPNATIRTGTHTSYFSDLAVHHRDCVKNSPFYIGERYQKRLVYMHQPPEVSGSAATKTPIYPSPTDHLKGLNRRPSAASSRDFAEPYVAQDDKLVVDGHTSCSKRTRNGLRGCFESQQKNATLMVLAIRTVRAHLSDLKRSYGMCVALVDPYGFTHFMPPTRTSQSLLVAYSDAILADYPHILIDSILWFIVFFIWQQSSSPVIRTRANLLSLDLSSPEALKYLDSVAKCRVELILLLTGLYGVLTRPVTYQYDVIFNPPKV
ncbi:hypothetical protein Tco_0706850 [Tanacetum coccineum]|uniref:Uncharacterized protein n=1 Tax=Tanacetum coccineum TaxID=301880 RepID=A0ABQ4Y8J8_9ASTR